MRSFKKITAILLVTAMAVSVFACSKDDESKKKKSRKDRDEKETEEAEYSETETEIETEVPPTTAESVPDETEPHIDNELEDKAIEVLLSDWKTAHEAGYEYDDSFPEVPWYSLVLLNYENVNGAWGRYDFNGDGQDEVVIAAISEWDGQEYVTPIGIYAFDGEKMVYLCKDMPLGERCSCSYIGGDVLTYVGSGGAAEGYVIRFTIGDDGYSMVVVDDYTYRYDEEGNISFEVREGYVDEETFDLDRVFAGFEADIEYTKFIED